MSVEKPVTPTLIELCFRFHYMWFLISTICLFRLVSVGDLEAAVSLLLSTPPEGSHFYPNALRAVVLSSAVSQSLHELAVKVSGSVMLFLFF